MATKSKIKSIKLKKDFQGKEGTMYIHTVEFENGEKGEVILPKSLPSDWAEGVEKEYELKPNANPNFMPAITIIKAKGNWNGGGGAGAPRGEDPLKTASVAYGYAKDLAIGKVIEEKQIKSAAKKILADLYELAGKEVPPHLVTKQQ